MIPHNLTMISSAGEQGSVVIKFTQIYDLDMVSHYNGIIWDYDNGYTALYLWFIYGLYLWFPSWDIVTMTTWPSSWPFLGSWRHPHRHSDWSSWGRHLRPNAPRRGFAPSSKGAWITGKWRVLSKKNGGFTEKNGWVLSKKNGGFTEKNGGFCPTKMELPRKMEGFSTKKDRFYRVTQKKMEVLPKNQGFTKEK